MTIPACLNICEAQSKEGTNMIKEIRREISTSFLFLTFLVHMETSLIHSSL